MMWIPKYSVFNLFRLLLYVNPIQSVILLFLKNHILGCLFCIWKLMRFSSSFLLTGQINTYCQNIKEFNAQNLGKLFMAQALQDYNNWRNFAITFNRMNFTVEYCLCSCWKPCILGKESCKTITSVCAELSSKKNKSQILMIF